MDDSADLKDIFGNEFDGESDENYREESGPHTGKKMARSERVKPQHIQSLYTINKITLVCYKLENQHNHQLFNFNDSVVPDGNEILIQIKGLISCQTHPSYSWNLDHM